MRRSLFVAVAVACGLLFLPDAGQAQGHGHRHHGHNHSRGWSAGFGYVPSYSYGGYWGPNRGHYDYHPGHYHGWRYVPPHIDYHHRGHSHAVDPYTGAISPYPHRHWHR
jgi:hypothetical protein